MGQEIESPGYGLVDFELIQQNFLARSSCQENSECRYYYWYPIDYSPAPLYCYIYRSCQGGSDEMKVGFAIAGRHPGHYFLGEQVCKTRRDFILKQSINTVGWCVVKRHPGIDL
jgi:hypothetical protein